MLATGALERPLVFAATTGRASCWRARAHLRQPLCGQARPRAVVFTNNDSAYRSALDLLRAGVGVSVIDLRGPARDLPTQAAPRASASLPVTRSPGPRGATGSPPSRCAGSTIQAIRSRVRSTPCRAISCASRAAGTPPSTCSRSRGHAALRRRPRAVPAGRTAPGGTLGGRVQRACCAPASSRARAPGATPWRRPGSRPSCRSRRNWTNPTSRPRAPCGWCPRGGRSHAARCSSTCRTTSRPPTACARRRLPLDRARQALHDDRHGHRPGQDGERQCARHRCRDHRVRRSPTSA